MRASVTVIDVIFNINVLRLITTLKSVIIFRGRITILFPTNEKLNKILAKTTFNMLFYNGAWNA